MEPFSARDLDDILAAVDAEGDGMPPSWKETVRQLVAALRVATVSPAFATAAVREVIARHVLCEQCATGTLCDLGVMVNAYRLSVVMADHRAEASARRCEELQLINQQYEQWLDAYVPEWRGFVMFASSATTTNGDAR